MKITGKKIALLTLAAVIGLSAAAAPTPAQARWYDGHRYHYGHAPRGWVWNARFGYYVYAPPVYAAPVVVAAPPPTVVYAQPAPVVYAQPAPVVYAEPAPVGLSVRIH